MEHWETLLFDDVHPAKGRPLDSSHHQDVFRDEFFRIFTSRTKIDQMQPAVTVPRTAKVAASTFATGREDDALADGAENGLEQQGEEGGAGGGGGGGSHVALFVVEKVSPVGVSLHEPPLKELLQRQTKQALRHMVPDLQQKVTQPHHQNQNVSAAKGAVLG